MHGAYPQRVKDFSLGPQDRWGWLQHLGTTDTASGGFGTFQDWRAIFMALAQLEVPTSKEELAELEKVFQECSKAANAAFADNHNAGYYINSYTTKLSPTLDNVLKRLLDSVRRLQSEWQEKEAARQPAGAAPKDTDERPHATREDFRRTMQVLSRLEHSLEMKAHMARIGMAIY